MSRTRHAPLMFIKRGADVATPLHGEPLCGAPTGPGATTVVQAMMTCPDCIKMLSEGYVVGKKVRL